MNSVRVIENLLTNYIGHDIVLIVSRCLHKPTTEANVKASDVKFGVEVECYLPTGTIEALGGYHHGLQVAWLPNGWNGQSDTSLNHCPAGYRAAEIVSPILSGEEGLAQVWFTLEAIKELNGVVNCQIAGVWSQLFAGQREPLLAVTAAGFLSRNITQMMQSC